VIKLTVISGGQTAEAFRAKGPRILEIVGAKMTTLMFQLHDQIVEAEIPRYFPEGAPEIAGTVRAIPATTIGSVIHGEVQAGGEATTRETLGGPRAGQPVDYAQVQEEGVAHAWEIQPVLFASAQSIAATRLAGSVKQRALSAEGLPRALAFKIGGDIVIVRRVEHPPLAARPYMLSGLEDMESKIISDLNAALTEAIAT
jgi:hypothetical protein